MQLRKNWKLDCPLCNCKQLITSKMQLRKNWKASMHHLCRLPNDPGCNSERIESTRTHVHCLSPRIPDATQKELKEFPANDWDVNCFLMQLRKNWKFHLVRVETTIFSCKMQLRKNWKCKSRTTQSSSHRYRMGMQLRKNWKPLCRWRGGAAS